MGMSLSFYPVDMTFNDTALISCVLKLSGSSFYWYEQLLNESQKYSQLKYIAKKVDFINVSLDDTICSVRELLSFYKKNKKDIDSCDKQHSAVFEYLKCLDKKSYVVLKFE